MDGLPFRYLTVVEVSRVLGRRSKTWAEIKAGQSPKGELHGKRRLWRSDVITRCLEERSTLAQMKRSTEDG
jgi:hypothetical protein